MSSSKKKKLTTECIDCNCIVLSKDLEKHKVACGSVAVRSEVQILQPNEVLVGVEQTVERWETFLAPEIYGWIKQSSVLVHPETMGQLGIVPRQPCLYRRNGLERVVLVWPCEMVSQLRICVGSKMSPGLAQLYPVRETREIKYISLTPLDISHSFYLSSQFRDYASAFLSGGYVLPNRPFKIPFYGHLCEFVFQPSLETQINNLSVSESQFLVYKMASKLAVSVVNADVSPKSKTLTFDCYGGGKKAKTDLLTYLVGPLKSDCAASSLILSGISGTGKSLMLKILAAELKTKAIVYNNDENFDSQVALLKDIGFCSLLIDDIERQSTSERSLALEKLSRFMDENENVSVVLAVQNIDRLEISLRRRFTMEIELTVPSTHERMEILKIILQEHKIDDTDIIFDIAGQTYGFTGSDLYCVYKLARIANNHSDQAAIKVKLNEAVKRVRPTGIREIVLEVPNVRWEDVGGYSDLKNEIKQVVLWPQQFPEAFARFNLPAPSGILLYGPPGCSKTLVARALASQSRLNFLAVKGPELFSKWVGESERAVREIFRRARQVAPSIIFFDEIDAVAVSRGEKSGSGVGDRVLAQLLTELDGLEKKSGVIVLAATNRPDTLDGAILRPGRLDKAIYVPLPDSMARKAILELQTCNVKLHDDVNIDEIISLTEGYSGAEVVAVYRNAALIALREKTDVEFLQRRHFTESLKTIVPRTDKRLLEIYEKFRKGASI